MKKKKSILPPSKRNSVGSKGDLVHADKSEYGLVKENQYQNALFHTSQMLNVREKDLDKAFRSNKTKLVHHFDKIQSANEFKLTAGSLSLTSFLASYFSTSDIYTGEAYNENAAILLFSSLGLAGLGVLIRDRAQSKKSKSKINTQILSYKKDCQLRR